MSVESVISRRSLYLRMLIAALAVLAQDLSIRGGADAWTYNYSIGTNLRWDAAREWCQDNFMDMAIAQSQEEMNFLNDFLPFNAKHYWIGVRKVAGVWTWAGTNESVPEDAQNWAPGEPNGQVCVEIYIKRQPVTAKWNDEPCRSKKGTVCYTASCAPEPCSAHADCMETFGNYSCRCHPGFTGPRCEETISCEPLAAPKRGFYHCSDPLGASRFSSRCQFSCELGFRLVGAPQLLCQASGSWNHPAPLCRAEQCPALNHTSVSGGRLSCSHPIALYSYNSTCELSCDEGYELTGQDQIVCDHAGRWTASAPACAVKKCSPIFFAAPGIVTCVDSVEPFSFGSQCNLTCGEGYYLNGDSTVACLASGRWSQPAPTCTAVRCHRLTAPASASVRCQHPLGPYSYGSECVVQCGDGFELIGTNVTKCSSEGDWSHPLPVCQAKRCPALNASAHGSLLCSHPHGRFSFGSLCTCRCEDGFLPDGTVTTGCTSLGTWSADVPHCSARLCPLLVKAPPHGRMNCSHPYAPFSYGSHCDFACNEGFSLRGPPAVTCGSSGLWSQDAPSCQPLQCEAFAASSLLLSMNCSHPLGNFSFGSQCVFGCRDGLPLNGTEVLLCTSSGVWNDSLPTCTARPAGAALMLYAGVGSASAVIPLTLIGLALLIFIRHRKRGNKLLPDVSAWDASENPAFEF